VQVARQVRHDFSLDESTRTAVADICRMVEGLPLALVLLAAWIRVLPCLALAAQLRRSMDVIRSSQSRFEDSSMSLRVVLEQSWQSLHPEDGKALAALSVFCGGFDQQAAQEIAGASLDLLLRLVDHSLVQVSPDGRYDFHDLVRQFAAEKSAEAGQVEQVATRHFDYYLRQAESHGAHVETFTDLSAYLWFGREYANLEEALLWARTHKGQVEDAAIERLSELSRLAGHRHGVHRRLW
jgi:predicted ATPase